MKNILNKKAKIGLSVIFTAVLVLAILVLVNFLMELLPQSATLLDTSENKMYSVSQSAKLEISKIEDDIDVYLLTAGGEKSLDDTGIHLNAFLKRATAVNKNINYSVIDLYAVDNFLENRGIDSSTVTLNSIIVESKLRRTFDENGKRR